MTETMKKGRLYTMIAFMLAAGVNMSATPCDDGSFMNPVSDVAWGCIFPVRIGGVARYGPNDPEEGEETDSVLCQCATATVPRIGISISFWEPARIIDTVSEPWCMMPLGKRLSNPQPGSQAGTLSSMDGRASAFQQMHYYQFPAWAILDLFTDLPCMEETEFDVMMMTELLPTWNNDILSLIVHPESVLFANPLSQVACAADAAAAVGGRSRNELFWCMGSWGSAYPLAGRITAGDYVEANAGLAARAIYLMARIGLLKDTNYDGCAFRYTPIWKKRSYKLQMIRPVTDSSCVPLGRTGMLWTSMKQPPVKGNNFSWMMFRRVKCCASYEYE